MLPTRTALLIPLLSLLALQSAAQQPADQPQDSLTTLHVTTRIVALDVVVSDGHGHPGSGLTAPDFNLTEDGVPQTIDSVVEHDASPPADSPDDETLPPNTFTVRSPVKNNGAMTVVVVVDSNWDDFIHSQLKAYFRTTPTTPTALFRMDRLGLHLIQGFTTNPALLVDAATSKRMWPPLGPRFHSDPASFQVRAAGPRTQALAAYLAGVPGRINIVWMGGLPRPNEIAQDFPDESSALADASRMVNSLNSSPGVHRLSRVALYSVNIGGCGRGVPPPSATPGGRSFVCTFPRDALKQIASTSYHYYTLSYRPSNSNWDGDYRHIHLAVNGYAQPPFTIRWSQLITGWADDVEPTLMYRLGYFADSAPAPDMRLVPGAPTMQNATLNQTANAASSLRRKLISASPKGDFGPNASQIAAATAFGSPTPVDLHFTIVVTPSIGQEKPNPHEILPSGNYLTTPFRDGPYRNYRIHYWIDPQELHLTHTSTGKYQEDLRTVAVVYRDDGVVANSLSTVTHLDLSAAEAETIQTSGFTLDQNLAIPTTENFFLRTAVAEQSTNHIGAIELPIEWIKPPQPTPLAAQTK
jgi:VWFA-related protein